MKEKYLSETTLKEFIKHWENLIYPYNETHPESRAIKTVIVELDRWMLSKGKKI